MLKMRSTYKRNEIQDILHEAHGHDAGVTLWQFENDNRRVFTGKFIEISDDKTIVEMTDLKQNQYELRPDEPLYIHGNFKKFVFKRETFTLKGDTLTVKTPSELKVEDLRDIDRFYFKYQDHKTFSFKAQSVQVTDQTISLTAVLVDLSIKGAAIILNATEADHLKGHSEIQITSITDQELHSEHKGKILYRLPFEEDTEGNVTLYRVGIQFDEVMDSVNYKSISSVIEKKQKKVEGLSKTTFCGLDYIEQERILANVEASDSYTAGRLRDNIDYLDKLKYLTPEMKKLFLQEFNHNILAVGLKLSHKEVIYELLSEVTETIQDEILFHMKDQLPISAIKDAQDKICDFVKAKEKTGEYVLDPSAFVTYV